MDTLLILALGFVIGGWVAADQGISRDQFYDLFIFWLLVALIYSIILNIQRIRATRKGKGNATHTD